MRHNKHLFNRVVIPKSIGRKDTTNKDDHHKNRDKQRKKMIFVPKNV